MSDKPQLIRPRNTMLERLGGRPGVPGKIDASLLKKAEDRIAEVGASYPDRVKADLEEKSKVEQMPRMEGRQMIMVLAPK